LWFGELLGFWQFVFGWCGSCPRLLWSVVLSIDVGWLLMSLLFGSCQAMHVWCLKLGLQGLAEGGDGWVVQKYLVLSIDCDEWFDHSWGWGQ